MKTSLSFFVPGKPIAQPRHQIKGRHRYIKRLSDGSPHPIHAWKELIAITAKQQEWDIVKMPDGVIIELLLIMKRPKSNKLRHFVTTPDFDNLTKAVTDALEGIIYQNDSQIYAAVIYKEYEDIKCNLQNGVDITITRQINENMSV